MKVDRGLDLTVILYLYFRRVGVSEICISLMAALKKSIDKSLAKER